MALQCGYGGNAPGKIKTVLNLPNILTLSRIFAVPLLVALLWKTDWEAGWLMGWMLYCLIGITDYFDGYLARAHGTVSKLGTFLDPIADKILVAAVILLLVGTRHDKAAIQDIHIIPALIILLREIAVSGLREFLAGLSVSVPVSRLAKWKTTFQMVALGGLILAGAVPDGWMLAADLPAHLSVKYASLASLWAAGVLTVITGWDYLRVGLKHMD